MGRLHRAQMLDLGANRLQQPVALCELRLDRVLLGETLRDDLLLLVLRVVQTRGLTRDVRAERRHIADDRALLVVDAIDGVDAIQQIVETRRAEENFDRSVRIARRVNAQRLTCERDLRLLQVDACDAELEARALQVLADAPELHVREVPTLDSSRDLCLDAADLGDDALRLCLLGCDGSGLRGRCRGDAESGCDCAKKCGYVTDSRPDNGLPARGQRLRASSPRKRHKVGTLTGFPDVRKVFRSQKLVKPVAVPSVTKSDAVIAPVCYVCRLVWRPARFAAPLLLVTIGCAICGAVGAASGANPAKSDIRSVAAMRAANDTLTQRIHTATLDLYSLDAQLERAHSQLAALRARA